MIVIAKKSRFFVSLLIACIFGSCGIDNYAYLTPVPSGIPMRFNTAAFIRLPAIPADQTQYFQNFVIYYRIYISGLPLSGMVSEDQMSQVNAALASDFTYLENSTDTTITTPFNAKLFSERKYYALALENPSKPNDEIQIGNVLGEGVGGSTITLEFAAVDRKPSLIMGDTRTPGSYTQYQLFRFSEKGIMTPYRDNRYFVNSDDINDAAFIDTTTATNLDVQSNSQSISGPRYTYVSMYIVSYGIDNNFSTIYSSPTFIGVFLLPD